MVSDLVGNTTFYRLSDAKSDSLLGWEIYTTHYVPDMTLIAIVSVLLVAIPFIGRDRSTA